MKSLFTILLTIFTISNAAATGPKTAYSMMQKGEAVIIDVREKDEIKSGMIKGAQWFPLSKVETDKKWKDEFIKMTDGKKIFLYCRTGKRSEKVMNILKADGISSENIGGYESLKNILPVTESKAK